MKNLTIFVLLAFAPLMSLADQPSHVHGAGSVSVVFKNGLKGRVEFKSPAQSVLGFEHPAVSERDDFFLRDITNRFVVMNERVQFSPPLKCVFKKDKIGMVPAQKGEHADFIATFNVTCKKSILDSKILFDFTTFSQLKELDVTVSVGSLQKSAHAKGTPVTVELK